MDDAARYLIYAAGGRRFATPLLGVSEIVEASRCTPLPDAAPFFRGLANLRGRLVSVIDLGLRLGLATEPATGGSYLIFSCPKGTMAAHVEHVAEVSALALGEGRAATTFAARVPAAAVLGLGRLGEEILPILDLAALVAEDELGLARERGAHGAIA